MDIRQCLSEQNLAEFQFQQARGLRQTSFQRLILHRLADRFCIAREVIPQSEHIVTSLNLIRLIKTEETSVPKRLVGDVDLGVLIDYRNPLASKNHGASHGGCTYNGSYNSGGYTALWDPNQQEDNPQPLSDQLASTTLDSGPPKKMVIMKRSPTDGTSSSHNNNKNESKSKNRKKNLVDKERAYEEARARIFGIEKSNNDGNDGIKGSEKNGSEGAVGAERIVDASEECNETEQRDTTKQQLNPTVTEFRPSSSLSDSHHSIASMGSNEPAANATEDDGTANTQVLPENQQHQECTASILPKESDTKQHTKHAAKNKQKPNNSPPSITKSKSSNNNKSTGKAVYRNRQQEEADPDFKRRSGPAYYTPASAVHQFSQNPYHAANPYNHVVNVAIGSSNPMTLGQPHHNMRHIHGRPYYGQQPYFNHLTAPQSPAFYGSGGYSQAGTGSPHVTVTKQEPVDEVKQNQSSLQTTNNTAAADSGLERNASNDAAKLQPHTIKPINETPFTVTAASIVTGNNCNNAKNTTKTCDQTLKPEDFPALR